MPSKFNSTAKKPGKAVKKAYNRGGKMRRNLRDEEARVIGVQDDAADELRRVKARRPHDAAERTDKRDQLARVGSRERNARDEMGRLRRKAVGLGMATGGKTKKQGYDDRLDEALGMRNRKPKKAAPKKAAPKKAAAKKAPAKRAGLSNKINQHKRMAMGEDVIPGKMIKKKKGK